MDPWLEDLSVMDIHRCWWLWLLVEWSLCVDSEWDRFLGIIEDLLVWCGPMLCTAGPRPFLQVISILCKLHKYLWPSKFYNSSTMILLSTNYGETHLSSCWVYTIVHETFLPFNACIQINITERAFKNNTISSCNPSWNKTSPSLFIILDV